MKVSVLLVTYNHESFLWQAIESALEQKTDYPIEVTATDFFGNGRFPSPGLGQVLVRSEWECNRDNGQAFD